MGRTAWIWMLLALLLVVLLLAIAWADGGEEPLRWIEQPVAMPSEAG